MRSMTEEGAPSATANSDALGFYHPRIRPSLSAVHLLPRGEKVE
jgi:hypothetical protein